MEYTKEQVELMLQSKAWPDRWAMARKGHGLEVLVHDEEKTVRAAVAEQGYGLDVLIYDPEASVRLSVAKQGYGLDILIHDENWAVRKAVAEMGYGLDVLVHDEDKFVRYAVLQQGYGLEILENDVYEPTRNLARFMLQKQAEEENGVENRYVPIEVTRIQAAEDEYLEGTVSVDGELYSFDYNTVTETVAVHHYSQPGWMTGASYEKPLPEVVEEHYEAVVDAVLDAVDGFLTEQENKKALVDELLSTVFGAGQVDVPASGDVKLKDSETIGF